MSFNRDSNWSWQKIQMQEAMGAMDARNTIKLSRVVARKDYMLHEVVCYNGRKVNATACKAGCEGSSPSCSSIILIHTNEYYSPIVGTVEYAKNLNKRKYLKRQQKYNIEKYEAFQMVKVFTNL